MSTVLPWTLIGDGLNVELTSSLYWSTNTPLEVKLVFRALAEDVEWTFARDLLLDGIRQGDAGHADVKVHTIDDTLFLNLNSPFGQVTLKTSAAVIGQFLAAIYAQVPRGQEDYGDATDLAIREIMKRDGLEGAG